MIKWHRSSVVPTHCVFVDDSPATHRIAVAGKIDTREFHVFVGTLAACEQNLALREKNNSSLFLTREIQPIA